MEWVRLADDAGAQPDLSDQPRFITDDDVNNILDIYINNRESNLYFPESPGADRESRQLARQCTVDWIVSQLKIIQLCPSNIPKLLYKVIETHYKSLITPGTPVAIGAGHSVGATTTQMTLNSVAPWEKLLIQLRNGVGHIVEIGKWVDLILLQNSEKIIRIPENRTEYVELAEPVKIVTTDNDGNVTWEDVIAVTRHLPVGDLVKITTKSGRSVTATQQKSFLVWDEIRKKLVECDGLDLEVGDYLPISNQVPEPDFTYDVLDLREYLDTKEWMFISEMEKLKEIYNDYNVPNKQRFWSSEDRLVNLPYTRGDSFLVGYRGILKRNLQANCVYPGSWGKSIHTGVPEKIVLDRKFGEIVGIYLAEGLVSETYVCISNNDPDVRQIVYDWCDSLGIGHHTDTSERGPEELHNGTSTDIRIHSTLFAELFEKWMGTGNHIKVMPEEILFGNRDFIIGVLDGYFAGDGCVNKKDGCLSISSVSEALIDGFIFLCSRLGIFSKKSHRLQKKNNKGSKNIKMAYYATIRALNADLWYETIGSCHPEKQEKMNIKYPRTVGWGKEYIKYKNIMLDPIVSIEFVKDVKYVYDVTVPKTLNLSLYNGLFLLDTFHSSGSAVSASFGIDALRDIIYARKIPKNEGCTIYYKNKYITYEEVLDSRKYIVGTVISDLVTDFDIDTPENIKGGRKWWNSANSLYDTELPESQLVMRLFLNVVEMYKHKITMKQLADILERETAATIPSVVVRYGPLSDGIIDLYPSERIGESIKNILYKKDKETIVEINSLAEATYLESIVLPELKNIRVKGIKGLRNLYPRAIPIWNIVLSEKKVPNSDKWILELNSDKMYIHGLDYNHVINLCLSAGLQAVYLNNNKIQVTMTNDGFRTSKNELVVNIDGIEYRSVNINNLNDDANIAPSIREVEGVLYQKLDKSDKKEKINKKPFIEHDNYYSLKVEKKGKKAIGPTRWIEEQISAKYINIPKTNILQFEKEYYLLMEDLYTISNGFAIKLEYIQIIEGEIYNNDIKIDNLYQDLTNSPINVNELKPSEYVNNKISEAKNLYREQVAKRTNEIIENDRKGKLFVTRIVKHTINFPVLKLVTTIPYDDIPYRDINKFLEDNELEFKDTRDENFVTAIEYISKLNYINLPDSISNWLDDGGDITIKQMENEIREIEEEIEEEITDDKTIRFKTPINIDRPNILKLSELIVADVDIPLSIVPENVSRVAIFKNLLGLHSIDKNRTTCNNMHTLTATFGIEAARTFIVKQLSSTISNNSSYVHPAHIMFIAEFITSRGVCFGTTFTGISRQPGGHLSLATVERAGKTFTQHALHGRKEDIRNVSASISVGARMVIGNGMFEIAQDITKNNKTVVLINDDVFKAHEQDERQREEEEETDLNLPQELDIEKERSLSLLIDTDDEKEIDLKIFEVSPDEVIGYVEPVIPKKRIITKIVKTIEKYQPIISEGLVIPTDIQPPNNGVSVPASLLELFDDFSDYPQYYIDEKSLI